MQHTQRVSWRVVAVFAAMATIVAACGGDDDEETTATTEEKATTTVQVADRGNVNEVLNLGYLLPSTGDLSALGPPMISAVKMAVRDINAAGGVLGKPVTLAETDDGTNEDVASASVDRLLNTDKVDAIIGAAGSRITLAVIDKITGAGVVECSPSNTGSSFTTYPDRGFYFRTAPPDNLQAQALADLITEDGHSRVALVHLNDEYGSGFAKFLKQNLEDAGAEVVADVAYDPAGTNFDADVAKAANADPEAVAIIAFPDTGGTVIKSMIEQGIGPSDVALYVTDGLQTKTLFEKIDPANKAVTQGIKGTAPAAAPDGGAEFFAEAFAEFAPGTDTIFSAHAYDCAIVIALAAEAAGSDDPGVFVEEMVNVTREGEKCQTYEACKALLDEDEDIDYDGAAGALDFVKAGEPGAGSYEVYEYGADGSFTVLEQVQVAGEGEGGDD